MLHEVLIRSWLFLLWKGLAPSSSGMATQGWRKKARRRVGGWWRPVKDSSSAHRGRHPITRAQEKLFLATSLLIHRQGTKSRLTTTTNPPYVQKKSPVSFFKCSRDLMLSISYTEEDGILGLFASKPSWTNSKATLHHCWHNLP